MKFSRYDWIELAQLFNTQGYGGYKPTVREAPNSDGTVDVGKRYLHVNIKYNPPDWAVPFLARAHFEACKIAEALHVPDAFYPRVENGTLRVLDYPVGAGTVEHTDFDLFTVNLWRNTPSDVEQKSPDHPDWRTSEQWTTGAPAYHMGRIGELVGLGPATPHRVPGRPYMQKALIYFAMPAMNATFPRRLYENVDAFQKGEFSAWSGRTVREWLDDVYSKSRVYT
jgi:hypothetical protein